MRHAVAALLAASLQYAAPAAALPGFQKVRRHCRHRKTAAASRLINEDALSLLSTVQFVVATRIIHKPVTAASTALPMYSAAAAFATVLKGRPWRRPHRT